MTLLSHLAGDRSRRTLLASLFALSILSALSAFAQQSTLPPNMQANAAQNALPKASSQPSAPATAALPPKASPANAALSKKAFEAGAKAVAANDLAAAYADFAEAVTLDPRNKNARLQRDNMGFRLMQQHQ